MFLVLLRPKLDGFGWKLYIFVQRTFKFLEWVSLKAFTLSRSFKCWVSRIFLSTKSKKNLIIQFLNLRTKILQLNSWLNHPRSQMSIFNYSTNRFLSSNCFLFLLSHHISRQKTIKYSNRKVFTKESDTLHKIRAWKILFIWKFKRIHSLKD